jgi:hypothetical protein
MQASQDAWIALAGTIFGGVGLEVIRRALAKSKEREDSATALRVELRGELTALKAETAAVEKELDHWKQKYYELFEKYVFIKVQYDAAIKALAANGGVPDEIILPPTPLDKEPEPPVVSDKPGEPDA